LQEAYLGWAIIKVISEGEMSLWLAAMVREMLLAIASQHATQTTAVVSEQAGYVPLPVPAITPNAKTMIGVIS
jgi:hypothetical protein